MRLWAIRMQAMIGRLIRIFAICARSWNRAHNFDISSLYTGSVTNLNAGSNHEENIGKRKNEIGQDERGKIGEGEDNIR